MNFPIVAAGLAIFILGASIASGFIGLSVVNSITFSNFKYSCDSSNTCTFTIDVTNINATGSYYAIDKLLNTNGQTIWIGSVVLLTGNCKGCYDTAKNLPSGTYTYRQFAVSTSGTVLSGTYDYPVTVGNARLLIDPYNPASGLISVSPSCSINPASQSSCPYQFGTSVTVTYTPQSNYQFKDWLIGSPSFAGTPSKSTENPLTITMNSNNEVALEVVAPNIQYYIVTPTVSITGCSNQQSCTILGSVSPKGDTKIYQDSTFGPTSAVFTATPNDANFTFSNWQTNNKNFTSNPLTLTYSDLKALQPSSIGGQTQYYLYAYFKQKIFYQLGVGAYAGITTNPAAKNSGTYTYPAGASVTVSVANVDGNVCFTGWLVDGNDAGTASSVTVTMNSYHSVFALGVGKPATGCTGGGGGSNSGMIGLGLMAAGGILSAFGITRKKR